MNDLTFNKALNLISWYPQGTLDSERIIDYFQQMKACSWGHQANRYCDFSNITNFILDYNKMKSLVTYRQSNLKEHTKLKVGIYCPSDVGYALSRMYQMLMEGFGTDTFISRELKEVAAFLQVEANELETITV